MQFRMRRQLGNFFWMALGFFLYSMHELQRNSGKDTKGMEMYGFDIYDQL